MHDWHQGKHEHGALTYGKLSGVTSELAAVEDVSYRVREEPVLGPKAAVPGPHKRRRGRPPGKKATALPRSNQVPGGRPLQSKEAGSAHNARVPASNKRPRGRPPKRPTEEAATHAPRRRGRSPGSGAAKAAAATTRSKSSACNTKAEDSKDGQHTTVPPPKTRKLQDQPRKLPADKEVGAAGTEPGSMCNTGHKSPGGSAPYLPEQKKRQTGPTPKAAAMLASAGTVGPAQRPPTAGPLGLAFAAAKPHAAAKPAKGSPGAQGDPVKPKRGPRSTPQKGSQGQASGRQRASTGDRSWHCNPSRCYTAAGTNKTLRRGDWSTNGFRSHKGWGEKGCVSRARTARAVCSFYSTHFRGNGTAAYIQVFTLTCGK